MQFDIVQFFRATKSSATIQLDKKVFPSPVPPENRRFFSFGLSKFFINFLACLPIIFMFSLGDISLLYFSSLTSSEYKFMLNFLKFSYFLQWFQLQGYQDV